MALTTNSPSSRPIRIAGCSGSSTDRRHALASLASNHPHDPIDVIIGDWMSEANMTARGVEKSSSANTTTHPDPAAVAYERTFIESLLPALHSLAKHRIKLAVNAGASDTERLHRDVVALVADAGLDLRVAWVSGDECLDAVHAAVRGGTGRFENLCTGEALAAWGHAPVYAQAYLGGLGIARALEEGADIVVCGRVSDASPVIGAAAWWHGWGRERVDELANAFVAGHLIECSTYVTGGNFSGFKGLDVRSWTNLGFPIAEISSTGQVVVTKQKGTGGQVTTQTCTSQLLYEIQGPWYFNSDVTAVLTDLWFEQLAPDRVALHGVKGDLPPPTTKIGLTAKGGYQAEAHWFLCGLDIKEKAGMIEAQIRHLLAPYSSKFTLLSFTLNGSVPDNPTSQNAATVDFRIFAQAPTASDLAPQKFLRPCIDAIMCAYPGATFDLDLRKGLPKPYNEYFVTLLPQSAINHQVHFNNTTIPIPPPTDTKVYPPQQPSSPTTSLPPSSPDFGPTTPGPLGHLIHARSGDKGSNANIGLWVRHADEYPWLCHLLSTATFTKLLGDEYDPSQKKKIDRFEFPGLLAVHFLLHDHLDRGVSSTSSYDFLAKNLAEFVRSRWVDLPVRFLNRGKL